MAGLGREGLRLYHEGHVYSGKGALQAAQLTRVTAQRRPLVRIKRMPQSRPHDALSHEEARTKLTAPPGALPRILRRRPARRHFPYQKLKLRPMNLAHLSIPADTYLRRFA